MKLIVALIGLAFSQSSVITTYSALVSCATNPDQWVCPDKNVEGHYEATLCCDDSPTVSSVSGCQLKDFCE